MFLTPKTILSSKNHAFYSEEICSLTVQNDIKRDQKKSRQDQRKSIPALFYNLWLEVTKISNSF